MKRATLLAVAATLVLSAAPAPSVGGESASVRASVREPRMKRIPGTTVYVALDPSEHDVFRYGGYWYLFSNGYWFRARSYAGAFARMDARRVPRAVMNVPAEYWRHPAPAPPSIARR